MPTLAFARQYAAIKLRSPWRRSVCSARHCSENFAVSGWPTPLNRSRDDRVEALVAVLNWRTSPIVEGLFSRTRALTSGRVALAGSGVSSAGSESLAPDASSGSGSAEEAMASRRGGVCTGAADGSFGEEQASTVARASPAGSIGAPVKRGLPILSTDKPRGSLRRVKSRWAGFRAREGAGGLLLTYWLLVVCGRVCWVTSSSKSTAPSTTVARRQRPAVWSC